MQTTQNNAYNTATPLVSFIVTYRDMPIDTLCECINSILALSLSNGEREIIIVDDGSPYCPMNDLIKYGDAITYIRKKKGGLSDSRNIGIKMASGKYIQFINGSDKLNQTPYEHCLDTVRYNSPDIVMFDTSAKECATVPYGNMTEPESGTEYMKHNTLRCAACSYIFRAAILGSLRFTNGNLHEDEEFTPQLFLRAENVYSTTAKAYMRRNEATTTHENDARSVLKSLEDKLSVILHLQDIADTLPANDSHALRRRIAQLTMDYISGTMAQTRSRHFVEKRIEELRRHGLFPLPDNGYTKKYNLFRRMTTTPIGRNILTHTLPIIKR